MSLKDSPFFGKLADIAEQTARENGLDAGRDISNSTRVWKRQVPPVEVVMFQVGVDYAWSLRLREKMTVIDEGTEKSFRIAALRAELAELSYYTSAERAEV